MYKIYKNIYYFLWDTIAYARGDKYLFITGTIFASKPCSSIQHNLSCKTSDSAGACNISCKPVYISTILNLSQWFFHNSIIFFLCVSRLNSTSKTKIIS